MRNGKKLISHKGIEILRNNDGLDNSSDSSDNSLNTLDNNLDNSYKNEFRSKEKVSNDDFSILKMENEFLKLQIKEKDNQIQTLSRLVENSQLLLKHEQDKNTMLINDKRTKKKWFWGIFSI